VQHHFFIFVSLFASRSNVFFNYFLKYAIFLSKNEETKNFILLKLPENWLFCYKRIYNMFCYKKNFVFMLILLIIIFANKKKLKVIRHTVMLRLNASFF